MISLVCFTKNGGKVCKNLESYWNEKGIPCKGYGMQRFSEEFELEPLKEGLKPWTKEHFFSSEALIFIGAAGIAIRAIAPFVEDKRKDPAVIVIDEQGRFVISLLSGHIGGGNDLAIEVANIIKGTPVITTATDLNNKFAVDIFARDNELIIQDMAIAKEISAQILEENTVYFYTEYEVEVLKKMPEELITLSTSEIESYKEKNLDEKKYLIVVSNKRIDPSLEKKFRILYLIPKNLVLGVGCKKGIESEKMEKFLCNQLEEERFFTESILKVATIDLKAKEICIIDFCEKFAVEMEVFTSEELETVVGEFAASSFVKSITGVDNVCERSAVLGSHNGTILKPKVMYSGMTLSISEKDRRIIFDE